MLTGDHRATATIVAQRLGITRIEAEVLPQDKQRIVEDLQREGRVVAMAGDGINDGPALARAEPERSDRLRSAFAAIAPSIGADAWDHTAVLVDDYAQSWIAERFDACEAATVTHLQSTRVMELRMACLERRQHDFAALLDALEDPLAPDDALK